MPVNTRPSITYHPNSWSPPGQPPRIAAPSRRRFHADGDFPAKTLDYETPPATARFTQPQYLDHSQELIEQLRELSPAQISELMHVSDKIGGLNAARFGSWTPAFTPTNAKQALLAFKGDVYTGLDAQSFGDADFDYAQQHLRMLSGLYGLLRPLDLMQPYRLEMGTKLANARGKDLYAFWGTRISEWLNEALADQGDDVLLNLASNEYFSAVKRSALKARVIDTEFRDLKKWPVQKSSASTPRKPGA
nr:hypothetical protein GCM10020185_50040 [Pseudomonas brassicacearum subsp. brassicacearum]